MVLTECNQYSLLGNCAFLKSRVVDLSVSALPLVSHDAPELVFCQTRWESANSYLFPSRIFGLGGSRCVGRRCSRRDWQYAIGFSCGRHDVLCMNYDRFLL